MHTAQMMLKCPLYAPIQIISCADCHLDCVAGILESHDYAPDLTAKDHALARAQDGARIVFDFRTADDPAHWITRPKFRMIRHNRVNESR